MAQVPDMGAIRRAYDEAAPGFEARLSVATRARLRQCDDFLLRHVAGAERVVEFGAGTVRLIRQVQAPRRMALDLSGEMCRQARAALPWVVQADMCRSPFADASWDAVLAGYGAAHQVVPARFLREVARVLACGGRFGLHLFTRASRSTGLLRRWSPWRAPGPSDEAPFEVDSFDSLAALCFGQGLQLSGMLLLRNLPQPPYFVRLPRPWLLPLATHVAVVGERLPRPYERQVSRIAQRLRAGGVSEVTVTGGSMSPTIPQGSRVHVVAAEAVRPGDVVLLAGRESLLVHRVVGRWGSRIVHRGDAPGAVPSWSSVWRVLGRVVSGFYP